MNQSGYGSRYIVMYTTNMGIIQYVKYWSFETSNCSIYKIHRVEVRFIQNNKTSFFYVLKPNILPLINSSIIPFGPDKQL